MPAPITEKDAEERREKVLHAARWCFLNFGFSKTSLEDIARRAGISRTLLYRTFRDKEDIFTAVFAHWLIARHPEALRATAGRGSRYDRLLAVCRVMAVEPWSDMVGAPMGAEFFDVCERLDPEIDARHRKVALDCVAEVLGDAQAAEVFLLALDGFFADQPPVAVLEERIGILAARFVGARPKTGSRRTAGRRGTRREGSAR